MGNEGAREGGRKGGMERNDDRYDTGSGGRDGRIVVWSSADMLHSHHMAGTTVLYCMYSTSWRKG